jgi:serine/threonine transporter
MFMPEWAKAAGLLGSLFVGALKAWRRCWSSCW